MKKILFVMATTVVLAGCSKNDVVDPDTPHPEEKPSVSFSKKEIATKFGESILLEVDKPIKECDFSSADEFIGSVVIAGSDIKFIPNKSGVTKAYVSYKGAKDSCFVTVNPKTTYFGKPVLALGISRDSLKSIMDPLYQSVSIGGFKGENYVLHTDNRVYYEFDSSDNIAAIKQVLKRKTFSFENIQTSLLERFDFKSGLTNVLWYEHPKVMEVRLEKTVSEISIIYAKHPLIMFEYFPWE